MKDFNSSDFSFPRTIEKNASAIPFSSEMRLMIMEAEELGIQWEPLADSDFCKLTYNGHIEFVRKGIPATNQISGVYGCRNKALTRALLSYAGVRISKGAAIMPTDSMEYRQEVFDSLNKPLVVKPAEGTHGKGVKLNITSFEDFNTWIDYLFKDADDLGEPISVAAVIEEMRHGQEYRVITTPEKVLAVMCRQPASVMGNGKNTIKELIDIKNTDPIRNISHDLYPHISIDEDMMAILKEQNLTVDSVPAENDTVILRKVSNIMAGGDAVDMTDKIHPSVKEFALKAIQALPGMKMIGLDFMTTDITADQATQEHGVVEINSAPEYAMHDMPMYGKKRGVAKEMLLMMFPELKTT